MINIKEATLKELVAQRPDLVQAIKNGEDEGTTSSYVEKDEKKRVKKWIGETRDRKETGQKMDWRDQGY
jgi:hypothetical protein